MSFLAPAGTWLWSTFGGTVVEQVVRTADEQLVEATRSLWNNIDWGRAAERYRGEMQLRYSTMRIIGMAEPVALADIFTDLFLLDMPSAWRRYSIKELQRQLQPEQSDEAYAQRRNALNLVRMHERLMILGKPGAGKTTLLKHLVLQCTTGKLDAVPIFVGLKAWADSGLELMPFLTRQFAICAFPEAQPFVEHILSEGRALVLFDGLDEVNLEQGARWRITQEVRDFADQYQRSRCVITCRTAASDYQFERFVYCELADFTEDQMRTFVAQWFQRDAVKRAAFLAEFEKDDHDRLRDLARTPLLLTLLCLTFEETMTFPPRRAEIYEEALDALLKKWDAARSIRRDTIYRTLSLGHKRQMLARIAAETFAKNQLLMRQDELVKHIVAYLQHLPSTGVTDEIDGEAILRSIEAQHGLLVERAQRIYSFSHLTLHEYFTARYIVEHPSPEMFLSVVSHARDVGWREVLLLTASMLDDANTKTFFGAFDESLRSMIQGDSALLPLFDWIQCKVGKLETDQQAIARESYVVLILITRTVSALLELLILARARIQITARDRGRVLTLARDIVCDLIRDLATARDRDRILDLTETLTHDFIDNPSFVNILVLVTTRALNLARFSEAQRPMTVAVQTDCVWMGILLWVQVITSSDADKPIDADYDGLLGVWKMHTGTAEPELRAALTKLLFPSNDAPVENWQQFATDLRAALVAHQDIGHAWMVDTAQLEHLSDYLEASTRMLECLDLAAVADRDAIRNRLLLPPQP